MSRIPHDNWSKREQLCLASAVSCSGDQNWITVSRTLKSVCGNGNNTARPADWYSQKNCAVQYGHLLETVESTKRKKRTNESNSSGFSSPATVTVETPTELLLRRLTDERQLEIKAQMRRDQELYSQVQHEIEALQSDEMSEQQLQQMWQDIEKEQETKRIDEMKLENRMREREQRKKDLVGSWRNSNTGAARRSNLSADTTSVDMDVEDITGSPAAAGNNNNKQPAAPAPLLTSLLKSPGGSNNGNAATSPTATTPGTGAGTGTATASTTTTGAGSVARATAPTITSLLTSGASGMPNQPAIVMKSPNDAAFMTRPISGPPLPEVATTGRSPSQAAPTLSMLLEKNKLAAATNALITNTNPNETQPKCADAEPNQTVELTASTPAEDAVDESDAETQQLLEVFQNMDEIMDDIDAFLDEDILKQVDSVESPSTEPAKSEVVEDFEDKLDALKREQSETETGSGNENENENAGRSPALTKSVEVVIGSSDDSNDNIPLAAVASQESSKERIIQLGEEASTASIASDVIVEDFTETITIASSSSEENAQETVVVELESVESVAVVSETATPEAPNQPQESAPIQETDTQTEPVVVDEAPKDEIINETDKATDDAIVEPKTPAPAVAVVSTVQDTDEETCSLTDSSKPEEPVRGVRTRQHSEHKPETEPSTTVTRQTPPSITTPAPAPTPTPLPARAPLLRKLPHRDRSESPMVDDDTATTASDHSTARSSTRRRCSSTPVIDSIPNSPASSEHTDDRRETRAASKKLFLGIYSQLLESKYAACFKRAFTDEHPNRQAELCLRPMDLPTIKRNIDSGQIRSIHELQRDILLMCQNLLLLYKPATNQHKTARLFMQECQALKEFSNGNATNTQTDNSSNASNGKVEKEKEKERTPAGNKARSGSRKSQRLH